MAERTWAIVVAAGEGRRFGAPKQFTPLGGRLVVEWAVNAARAVAEEVVLVVPADALRDASVHAGCRLVAAGAPTRSGSVRAGLALVREDVERIVIHDAARPLAPVALFESVLGALSAGVDAAIPGIAVRDTVKRVANGRVVETLRREELIAVQTPQAFRAASLRAAHRHAAEATDDAALVESTGGVVAVVDGDEANVKITSMADLEAMQHALDEAR